MPIEGDPSLYPANLCSPISTSTQTPEMYKLSEEDMACLYMPHTSEPSISKKTSPLDSYQDIYDSIDLPKARTVSKPALPPSTSLGILKSMTTEKDYSNLYEQYKQNPTRSNVAPLEKSSKVNEADGQLLEMRKRSGGAVSRSKLPVMGGHDMMGGLWKGLNSGKTAFISFEIADDDAREKMLKSHASKKYVLQTKAAKRLQSMSDGFSQHHSNVGKRIESPIKDSTPNFSEWGAPLAPHLLGDNTLRLGTDPRPSFSQTAVDVSVLPSPPSHSPSSNATINYPSTNPPSFSFANHRNGSSISPKPSTSNSSEQNSTFAPMSPRARLLPCGTGCRPPPPVFPHLTKDQSAYSPSLSPFSSSNVSNTYPSINQTALPFRDPRPGNSPPVLPQKAMATAGQEEQGSDDWEIITSSDEEETMPGELMEWDFCVDAENDLRDGKMGSLQ